MAELLSSKSAKATAFNFGDNSVRIIMRDGEPWFVASDVVSALGYRIAAVCVEKIVSRSNFYKARIPTSGALAQLS